MGPVDLERSLEVDGWLAGYSVGALEVPGVPLSERKIVADVARCYRGLSRGDSGGDKHHDAGLRGYSSYDGCDGRVHICSANDLFHENEDLHCRAEFIHFYQGEVADGCAGSGGNLLEDESNGCFRTRVHIHRGISHEGAEHFPSCAGHLDDQIASELDAHAG